MSVAHVFPIIYFLISQYGPIDLAVEPTNVTLHYDAGVFTLEFDDIMFTVPKYRNDYFFLGPDITHIDSFLRDEYQVKVDTASALFEDSVNFITDAATTVAGSIGGAVYQPWVGKVHIATYLPANLNNELIVGMQGTTVELPVVSLAARSADVNAGPIAAQRRYTQGLADSC